MDRTLLSFGHGYSARALASQLMAEISPVLQAEARNHPGHAASIAYTFYDWQDWSLTDHFKTLLGGQSIAPADRYILTIAVAAAGSPP